MALMIDENPNVSRSSGRWWVVMFRDAQFWVPLAVLLGGLILLRAIQ